MTSIRSAIRSARTYVSMPRGRGMSWTFEGPETEIHVSSYWWALAKRRAMVAWTAVGIIGGDPVQQMVAQCYVDGGDSIAVAVRKAMQEAEA